MSKSRRLLSFPRRCAGIAGSARSRAQSTGGVAVCRQDGPRRRCALTLTLALFVALSISSAASAHFTHPLLCQITGPFSKPSAFAVDESDHLWVGENSEGKSEPGPVKLYEFEPAYSACGKEAGALEIQSRDEVDRLAIDNATGRFYVAGNKRQGGADTGYVEVFGNNGTLIQSWPDQYAQANLAVDNSSDALDPGAGSIYVSHDIDPSPPLGDGLGDGVGKFDAEGAAMPFTGSGSGPTGSECAEYVEGNQILGAPQECFAAGSNRPVAVDAEGNIYVVKGYTDKAGEVEAVYEFDPQGVFVRAFTGAETPGIKGEREEGGFGSNIVGVALDPVSGHLLVSVNSDFSDVPNVGVVDEFDATTGKFIGQIAVSSPVAGNYTAGAMSSDSRGDLYVSVQKESSPPTSAIDVYGSGRFLPTLTSAEASSRSPEGAVLSGTVNPEGFALSECRFQYVSEEAFEQEGFAKPQAVECEPAVAELLANAKAQPVQAKLAGLPAGVTYRFRLAAASSGALGGADASEPLAFTTLHAPRVESASASNVSSEYAQLEARIDPLGVDTAYRFEYSSDGATWIQAPAAEASIGSGGPSGGAAASVEQQIGGLVPGTTYRFRVAAENAFGPAPGGPSAEGSFTTLAAAQTGLPDGRAYELLTPPDKGDAADLFGNQELISSGLPEFENETTKGFPSASGEEFLLLSNSALESAEHTFPADEKNVDVFSRAAGGWRFTPLASPALGAQTITRTVFDSADLSMVGIDVSSGSGASETGTAPTTLIGPPGGPYTTLHVDTAVQVHGDEGPGGGATTTIVAASHGLGQVLLESQDHSVCPGAGGEAEAQDPGSEEICEWTAAGGLSLVDVDSEGALLNRCGAVLGEGASSGGARNSISSDGSRIFFTAPDPYLSASAGPGCWNGGANTPQLYMRSGGETVKVSAPEEGVVDPTGSHPAVYVGASESGERVFFMSEAELTADDLGVHDPELYEYNAEAPEGSRLTRISAGEAGSPVREPGSIGAHVLTVPAVSADGSAVYFTAFGRLTRNAPAASGGAVDLYRYDTLDGETTYVATVNEGDYISNEPNWEHLGPGTIGDVALHPEANWYTTPDGRYLLFATGRELTGYETTGDCDLPGSQGDGNDHCDEVYRYDADAAELHAPSIVCVSCDPSGAPPVSNALFERSALRGADAAPLPAMSEDGAYVFFDSADPLVPQAENKTLDVYEWHEGRISLIGSGSDHYPSFFLGESPYVEPDGEKVEAGNVFFGTHAQLVPQDTDTDGDLYDARIGGGFPPPGAATAVCEGDACDNPPPAPIDSTPVSLTFSGPGNLASASGATAVKKATSRKVTRCPRGKKLSRGKCVKAKSRKRAAKAKSKKEGK